MSRSGYSEDLEPWDLIKWRGQVASAIRGRRGQKLLREMLAALDAMPVKELIAEQLEAQGKFCALGVVGQARGVDMAKLDPYDSDAVAKAFDIAHQLAQEIAFENDDGGLFDTETPAERWLRVRNWVAGHIKASEPQ